MIRIWFGRCVWHLRPNFANRGGAAERCKTVAVGNARVILSASEGLTDRDCGTCTKLCDLHFRQNPRRSEPDWR
jgi:hypothetical protein